MQQRLAGTGVSQELADRWVAASELEAAARGLAHDAAFWDAGWAWIAEERSARKVPG